MLTRHDIDERCDEINEHHGSDIGEMMRELSCEIEMGQELGAVVSIACRLAPDECPGTLNQLVRMWHSDMCDLMERKDDAP